MEITIENKDKVLSALVNAGGYDLGIDINQSKADFGFSRDALCLILDQFEEMGFLSQLKCLGGTINVSLTAKIFDFHNRGGFAVQEELLAKNIEKLLLEVESLRPSFGYKVATITTIAANIATALGFLTHKP